MNAMTTPNEPAATPAVADTSATPASTPASTPAAADHDDGIIDLDAHDADEPSGDEIEDGNLATTAEEEPAPEPAETPEEKREKLSGAQRAKLKEQKLQDEIARLTRERDEARQAREPQPKTPAKAGAAAEDLDMPKEEDFNGDYFAYREARAAHIAAKAAKESFSQAQREQATAAENERAAEAQRVVQREHLERVETAKGVIADYDTVMEGMKGVEARDEVIAEIMDNENSAVIAYHLAKNPSELEALNRMTPRQITREIARLGERLELPEPKKITSAPPPLSDRSKGGSTNPNRGQEASLNAWLNKKYGPNRK